MFDHNQPICISVNLSPLWLLLIIKLELEHCKYLGSVFITNEAKVAALLFWKRYADGCECQCFLSRHDAGSLSVESTC